ncbi:hypothetical protein KUV28_15080 [Ferrimonas balearica]|nr:hypothetical protein [Ferrimonas balearica]
MLTVGKIVAWLALALGVLRTAMGFFVASIDDPASRTAAASRYLGSATSGEAIDQGIKIFVFGLALGILVKIGRSMSARKE